jgi:hypothetical protein
MLSHWSQTSTPSPSTSGATVNWQDIFELSILLTIHTDKSTFHHPQCVYNVIPGNYTHDGKLDMLIIAQSTSIGQLLLFIYPSMLSSSFCELFQLLPCSFAEKLDRHESNWTPPFHHSLTHPLWQSDADWPSWPPIGTFLAQDVEEHLEHHGSLWSSLQGVKVFECYSCNTALTPLAVTIPLSHLNCHIANLYSNVDVDLNGDCVAGPRSWSWFLCPSSFLFPLTLQSYALLTPTFHFLF